MNAGERNRVRLWLRSERAWGLGSVGLAPRAKAAVEGSGVSSSRLPGPPLHPSAAVTPQVTPMEAAVQVVRQPPSPTVALGQLSPQSFPSPQPGSGLMPPPSVEPFTAPPLTTAEKRERLAEMDANEVKGCPRCRLCETRTNTVFGEGDPDAAIFFIGEGPGETEDQTGRPFVGRAGGKLDEMIAAMGLGREQVYIANVVKCRPPGNREPAPDEVATCTPYLERQLEIVRPRVIVTLGRPAVQHMLQVKTPISRLRGHWQMWRSIRLMPTFHPAYLLRNYTPETRKAVWSDLKQVMAELGLVIPTAKKN